MRAPRGTKRAINLYRGFREASPQRAMVARIKLPKVAMVMGHVRAIEYETTLAGRTVPMRHRFAKGSRPILAAGSGRNRLLLVGGRYHVTERGIVDLSPNGREIEDFGYKSGGYKSRRRR